MIMGIFTVRETTNSGTKLNKERKEVSGLRENADKLRTVIEEKGGAGCQTWVGEKVLAGKFSEKFQKAERNSVGACGVNHASGKHL